MTDDLFVEDALIIQAILSITKPIASQRRSAGQAGQDYLIELLTCGHARRFRDAFHMELETFYALRDWFVDRGLINGPNIFDNLNTGGSGGYLPVSVEEKLAIFLEITTKAISIDLTAEKFARSAHKISKLVLDLVRNTFS